MNENDIQARAAFRAQKLDKNGKKQWDDSAPVLSYNWAIPFFNLPLIKADSSGGFIVSVGGLGPIIWKIGPDGKLLWEKRQGN